MTLFLHKYDVSDVSVATYATYIYVQHTTADGSGGFWSKRVRNLE